MEKRKVGSDCKWVLEDGREVHLMFVSFPYGCKKTYGMCMVKGDGYLIVINTDQTQQRQRKALGHELCHIYSGHFLDGNQLELDDLEEVANRHAWRFYRLWRDNMLTGRYMTNIM